MDLYVAGIVVVSLIIMIGMMTHGYHTGFVREVTGLISLVASTLVILLIAGIVEGFRSGNTSGLVVGLILLVIFGVIWRFLHMCISSINFIARLPIIHWLDAVLGLFTGLLEGFAVLYVLEYFLRNFLLA